MNDETRYPRSDLDRFRECAKTRRELAWELLKQTRNAPYVALRYGYDIETMEAALEKIPTSSEPRGKANNSDKRKHSPLKRARDLLPEVTRSRVPGEDDDLGE
jgi:hypothetical protein